MNWIFPLVVVCGLAILIFLKRLTWVSRPAAESYLKQGGVIIDVRSPSEFQAKHLPGAINLPLGSHEQQIRKELPDSERALLLHCLSGTRSAMARRQMRQMGYKHVFNLGSYGRAEAIARSVSRIGT